MPVSQQTTQFLRLKSGAGNSYDYEAVCGSTAVLLILPAAEFRGGIAFRFGFSRLFELPTLGSLPTAGIFFVRRLRSSFNRTALAHSFNRSRGSA